MLLPRACTKVYAHYGRQAINNVLGLEEGDATTEILFDKMYANFIEEYDGKDNGVNQYDGDAKYVCACKTKLSARSWEREGGAGAGARS